MRILITGASGNLGTALLRRLGGEHEVVAVSRRRPPAVAPYSAASWESIDLAGSSAVEALTAAMRGCDAVVHLAWAIQPSRDRERLRRVNQGGAAAVLEAMRGADVAHLVCVSSVGAYSPGAGRWVGESWPTGGMPAPSYSVDKAAVERLLDAAQSERTITRVRPAVVLHEAAASEVMRYFIGRLAPVSLLRPSMLRLAPWPSELGVQFVHADDVAEALALFLRERPGGAFNLAAEPVIDRDSLRAEFGGVGPPMPPAVVHAGMALAWRLRLQPTEAPWFDMAMALPWMRTDRARELGWTPRHRATDALRSFVGALSAGQGTAGPLLYPRRDAGDTPRADG